MIEFLVISFSFLLLMIFYLVSVFRIDYEYNRNMQEYHRRERERLIEELLHTYIREKARQQQQQQQNENPQSRKNEKTTHTANSKWNSLNSDVKSRILKVKELTLRGVQGEKEAALNRLNAMMSKHGLVLSDLP